MDIWRKTLFVFW